MNKKENKMKKKLDTNNHSIIYYDYKKSIASKQQSLAIDSNKTMIAESEIKMTNQIEKAVNNYYGKKSRFIGRNCVNSEEFTRFAALDMIIELHIAHVITSGKQKTVLFSDINNQIKTLFGFDLSNCKNDNLNRRKHSAIKRIDRYIRLKPVNAVVSELLNVNDDHVSMTLTVANCRKLVETCIIDDKTVSVFNCTAIDENKLTEVMKAIGFNAADSKKAATKKAATKKAAQKKVKTAKKAENKKAK